jgi:hypothetical protein
MARSFALVVAAIAALFASSADASAFLATDKNFDSAVLNSGKHAFVKFLAPWYVFIVPMRVFTDVCAFPGRMGR